MKNNRIKKKHGNKINRTKTETTEITMQKIHTHIIGIGLPHHTHFLLFAVFSRNKIKTDYPINV